MAKLWGGRFKGGLDPSAIEFSYSLSFDSILLPYDIAVNKAHATALVDCGVLTHDERVTLHESLDRVLDAPEPDASCPDEDIHSYVERMVVEDIGDLGKKMHTGKSRNDQVATDMRLYVKDSIERLNTHIHGVMKALYGLACAYEGLVFPGFTHLQVAQPVLFSHHILAYIEKLKRDQNRLVDAYERTDVCPLGSAAMAGPNYMIDRQIVAKILGFSDITLNSMDAVSDRDFVLDTIYACTMITLHVSQFCEELIFWTSSVVGFASIGDAFTTGSSIMPQKKNPDIAELIRGQAGPLLGQFVAVHEIIKGLPLTYNRDLQTDKKHLFQAIDITESVLACMAHMVPTITMHESAIQQALNTGHVLATEIADYLVQKGVPFRTAHDSVGEMVQLAESNRCQVHELSLRQYQGIAPDVESDILDRVTVAAAINSKQSIGGTANKQVRQRLQQLKEEFKW